MSAGAKELQSLKLRFGLIGNAENFNRALSIAVRVAPTPLTTLIQGESGTGKEVFSKIIHSLSARKHNGFIAVNCGAIPEGTIDSELFGHEKGAFTGAQSERKGYFETVNGGTIFLDEIGEMPLGTQSRLLRVLEDGDFIKVGSSKVQKTDVRVVAATNVNLSEAVQNGKFREDLYYRLSTILIEVPPLRNRREDIYLLFRKFCVDFSERHHSEPISLDAPARELLESFPWPGNIRQLKNVAEQASVLSTTRQLNRSDLAAFLPSARLSNYRNLPVLARNNDDQDFLSEREIMYKLLFDMRKDINDLKAFIVRNVADLPDFPSDQPQEEFLQTLEPSSYNDRSAGADPIILSGASTESVQIEEESLSIAAKEKELITKALKKHGGRRKEAALDLGISERTLYRKIKEYELKA